MHVAIVSTMLTKKKKHSEYTLFSLKIKHENIEDGQVIIIIGSVLGIQATE